MIAPEKREKLEAGWEWMKRVPDGPEKDAFFERWLKVKDEYEAEYKRRPEWIKR
jgi:predicted dithiol-disulfide oxidoreductase (DUF899 family)